MRNDFADESGNVNTSLPISAGQTIFTKIDNGTLVEFNIIYQGEII